MQSTVRSRPWVTRVFGTIHSGFVCWLVDGRVMDWLVVACAVMAGGWLRCGINTVT